jgi:outer membrane lipoprotein-sorting protein
MHSTWTRTRAALAAIAVLGLTAAPTPNAAAEEIAERAATLDRIETYLNGLGTLQSEFIQVSSDGTYAQGRVAIAKPGKMRMEYHPPVPVVLISDGTFLVFIDTELDQMSHIPLVLTPAALLLDDDLSFDNPDLTVLNVEHAEGLVAVTVTQSDSPEEGALTLTFEDKPFQLRRWRLVDAQGVTTDVTLLDPRTGIDFDEKLFQPPVRAPSAGEPNK